MAGRFINPYPQFLNSTPAVYSSGTLTFYASGTSTPLDTYSNEGLSVANTNPIVLNSAGRPAVDIFLQDAEYKVVLKDSSGNTIWTADPVSARDSAMVVKTLTGSGSPNGSVAGTAGSSGIIPDMYWDYTNAILYVCTTTGDASTTVWTALNAASPTAAIPPPQGRLTMTSGVPVLLSSVTAGTAVYYTPYVGNLVPIYNGATMIPTEFAELTLTLSASHLANAIYDVFLFSNAGVVTVVTGPAWTTATAGAGARGTGASSAELARVKGLYVNAVSMSARNGATTYTIGANLATYVGSIFMDGTNGQLSCLLAWGSSRKWGVWNAYNRKPIVLKAGDSTASWTYQSATIRQSRATATNTLSVFQGLPEEMVQLDFLQRIDAGANTLRSGVSYQARNHIGVNSTTAASGLAGDVYYSALANGVSNYGTGGAMSHARHVPAPFIGVNNYNCLESTPLVTDPSTFYGSESDMLLQAVWAG